MKTLSQKSRLLLLGVPLAVCAFVVPTTASAATWQTGGSVTHRLSSPNFTFNTLVPTTDPDTTLGGSCGITEFDADVASASTIEITGVSFDGCRGTGIGSDCTLTATATQLPWTMTAPTTTTIQIHGIRFDLTFETGPGFGCTLVADGLKMTLTGTLTGGSWDPSSVGADRRVTFRNADGLTAHSGLGLQPATVNADLRDTTGTWNLID